MTQRLRSIAGLTALACVAIAAIAFSIKPGRASASSPANAAGTVGVADADTSITTARAPAAAASKPPSPAGASATTKGWTGNFKKPEGAELRNRLTPLQYQVTQNAGTERAFANEYWDNHSPGIYVDIVSGEPLFSSLDKYDSGTGWPSFTMPLERENIKEASGAMAMFGSEVRSTHADSHLGHVFGDGPPPAGVRYCMNSAAMRFIPAEKLEAEGYGRYRTLFASTPPPAAP